MGVTYWKADADTMRMVSEILEEHRPDLSRHRVGLAIGVLMAISDSEDGHPLKVGGWPCEARVSIVPAKHRASGGPDVLVEIDAPTWRELSDIGRKALLHHEIHHIELVDLKRDIDEDGHITYVSKLDDSGRVAVKLRKHDYQVGGFREIHELYGDDSPERRGLVGVEECLNQQVFPFATASVVAAEAV